MVFQPQRAYTVILMLGLAVSGSMLLMGLFLGIRTARGRSTRRELTWPVGGSAPSTATLAMGWLLVLAAMGPITAAALVLGLLAARWTYPRRRGWRIGPTTVAALGAGGLVVASSLIDGIDFLSVLGTLADPLAATGVGVVLGLVASSLAAERNEVGT
jgi:hypothetical protein